jgi:2-polyprenyl-3-methyl-5-hydroxy-6-metoxy-1,4-benzoquinol methylase
MLRPKLRSEAGRPQYQLNERVVEYPFALGALGEIEGREVLDVGTGASAWPHLMANCGYIVNAVDKYGSYWRRRMVNRHFHVTHQDITEPTLTERYDAITCISVLEHIEDHRAAVRGMFSLLRPSGRLIVTVPYNERTYHPDAYRHPDAGYGQDAPYICQVYSRAELERWLADNDASIAREELFRVFTGELWTQGERIHPPQPSTGDDPHHLICLALEARSV